MGLWQADPGGDRLALSHATLHVLPRPCFRACVCVVVGLRLLEPMEHLDVQTRWRKTRSTLLRLVKTGEVGTMTIVDYLGGVCTDWRGRRCVNVEFDRLRSWPALKRISAHHMCFAERSVGFRRGRPIVPGSAVARVS